MEKWSKLGVTGKDWEESWKSGVNWELQVETGKNHGKVDSLSQWLHTVLNGCGP